MKYPILIFLSLLFFQTCKSPKNLEKQNPGLFLKARLAEYVNCLNDRNETCLQQLYSKDYQSLSPVNKPVDLNIFIKNMLRNLEQNNFEIAIQIKEIQSVESMAYVTMDWHIKTKGISRDTDPFANVQRLDIWKKDNADNWVLFRTVIYNERVF